MTPSDSHALMQRELDEQAGILEAAAGPLSKAAAGLHGDRDSTIWIGGCGDSLFAAQAMAGHFRTAGWDMRAASAAEMLWDAPISDGDRVVGISISGSTRRTVEALAAAKARGARTLAITLKPESALAETADAVLPLPYTPISRAIPHGLDYHVTLLALAALAGPIDCARMVEAIADATPGLLAEARRLAAGLGPEARFVFLGAGPALGSANFSAAKLHEAGGLPAFSHESENFAHGAHFMLRPGDHAVLVGAGGPGDARTFAMAPGLGKLGVSVATVPAVAGDGWISAHLGGLSAQALCLAVAEARALDVTDPGAGSTAAAVQREWFGWTAG
ncbi:SIS domain-containing protein [uncultured Jannaschia sp.]|uniref:SIS domain-containing protein n=1 Tax=uncultured Jannaschia sp. TaxID=293347 RepID=UPI0026072C61|nr:SIS domain-containing protein [uncultured Jannaschia sp.]